MKILINLSLILMVGVLTAQHPQPVPSIDLKLKNYYTQNERAYYLLLTGLSFSALSAFTYTQEKKVGTQYPLTYFFGSIGAGFTFSSVIVKKNSKKGLK